MSVDREQFRIASIAVERWVGWAEQAASLIDSGAAAEAWAVLGWIAGERVDVVRDVVREARQDLHAVAVPAGLLTLQESAGRRRYKSAHELMDSLGGNAERVTTALTPADEDGGRHGEAAGSVLSRRVADFRIDYRRMPAFICRERALVLDRLANRTPAVIWYHGEGSYSRDGKTPVMVSPAAHKILQRFLDGKVALATRQLEFSGVNNVSQTVILIQQMFPGTVDRPGKEHKGRGYFIRVRSLAPPK